MNEIYSCAYSSNTDLEVDYYSRFDNEIRFNPLQKLGYLGRPDPNSEISDLSKPEVYNNIMTLRFEYLYHDLNLIDIF